MLTSLVPWMEVLALFSAFFDITLVGVLGHLERVEVSVPHSAFAGASGGGEATVFSLVSSYIESYFLNVSVLPFPCPLTREREKVFVGWGLFLSVLLESLTFLAPNLRYVKQKETQGSYHHVL